MKICYYKHHEISVEYDASIIDTGIGGNEFWGIHSSDKDYVVTVKVTHAEVLYHGKSREIGLDSDAISYIEQELAENIAGKYY